MACGTPVISTDCPSGPSEIIGENEFGVLVPVEDYVKMSNEIETMLEDLKLSKHYSYQGSVRCEHFKTDKIVSEYDKIFWDTIQISSD